MARKFPGYFGGLRSRSWNNFVAECMMLDGRWRVAWTNSPRFGSKVQQFTGFSKYPPKLVRVKKVEQYFDALHGRITQSAKLDLVEENVTPITFTMHGTYEMDSSDRVITDFTDVELHGEVFPEDWQEFRCQKIGVRGIQRASFDHVVLQPHTRIIRAGHPQKWLTLFVKE